MRPVHGNLFYSHRLDNESVLTLTVPQYSDFCKRFFLALTAKTMRHVFSDLIDQRRPVIFVDTNFSAPGAHDSGFAFCAYAEIANCPAKLAGCQNMDAFLWASEKIKLCFASQSLCSLVHLFHFKTSFLG
jgi:hypothetical protein